MQVAKKQQNLLYWVDKCSRIPYHKDEPQMGRTKKKESEDNKNEIEQKQ